MRTANAKVVFRNRERMWDTSFAGVILTSNGVDRSMTLTHLPLLKVQLDLYALPRVMDRSRAYIAAMTDEETGDLALPLVAMNPMGKDHVPELIRNYLALDAEGAAVRAIADATPRVAGPGPHYRLGLVVSDDLKGGWTNRYAS